MTNQSLPISRTTRDYIYSALVVVFLIGSSTLAIYLTRSSDALIMRQPRMTLVVALTIVMFVTSYIFISRPALPFFSRPLAWGSVIVSVIAMGALWIFHSEGNDGAWFRFTVLCVTLTACSTVLAEVMIFYRRFFADKAWLKKLPHKIGFSVFIALITFSMSYLYYDLGVSGGAIIKYADFSETQIPDLNQQLPEGIDPGFDLDGLTGESPLPTDSTAEDVQNPDSPVSSDEEVTEIP